MGRRTAPVPSQTRTASAAFASACQAARRGGTTSQCGANTTSATPMAVLVVLVMMSPVLGSRPGIHCCRNSTLNERPKPIAIAGSGRTPASTSEAPRGMKSSRFSMSSASAASPEVRVKDQPGGSSVPEEWRVAMRMPRVERATARIAYWLRRITVHVSANRRKNKKAAAGCSGPGSWLVTTAPFQGLEKYPKTADLVNEVLTPWPPLRSGEGERDEDFLNGSP